MILLNPRIWVAAISTFVVSWVVLSYVGRRPPGPLTAVHERDPGGRSCSSCHGGWFSGMTESCLECHPAIDGQLADGGGLHGLLGREKVARCALCHSEHHGPEFAMVNQASFTWAGVPNSDQFDHGIIGFEMEGKHLEQACEECHQNAKVDVLPEGQPRFLGLDKDCSGCHEDAHEGRYVLDCAQCHGQLAFDQLASSGHERHLPLIGGHAEVSCRECHAENTEHSLEVLGAGLGAGKRKCADCHESPHRSAFIEGTALLTASPTGATCRVCHVAEHSSFREEGLEVSPEQHVSSGFRLNAPHDEVACGDCHPTSARDFDVRYPGRGPDECIACHDDPHAGQFDEGPFAAGGCIECHDRLHFEPHAFTLEKHERTSMGLTGQHVEIDCSACHIDPVGGSARAFRGTPAMCDECHGDAHEGYFDQISASLDPVAHGTCAQCHLTTSFSEIPGGDFDHHGWTGFPIMGAHAQGECESCHPRAEEADSFRRAFGRVSEAFGEYRGCVTCHRDPHEGDFDRPEHPREVDGRTGCARCHDETSFRQMASEFEHHRWTNFALQGAHRRISCAECHAPLPQPDEKGRTWERSRGRECVDCHADPHGDQFRVAGRNDCRRCHRTTDSFTDLAFNHEIHSRFPLGDAHSGLACATCHKPVLEDGVEVVRYRPLKKECVDCHGGQEDPFRGRKGKRR